MKQSLMSVVFAGLMAASVFAGPNGAYRNQQQRIAQGVKSGQSDTPREAGGLMSWAASKAVGSQS